MTRKIFAVIMFVLLSCAAATAQYENYKPVKDKATKKFGYQDKKTKEWVIEPVFDKAKKFSGPVAIVTVDDMDGLIDGTGTLILPAEYRKIVIQDEIGIVLGDRYMKIGGEGPCADHVIHLWGVYGLGGREIIKPLYDNRLSFSRNGLAVALRRTDMKYGALSIDGRTVVPFDHFALRQSGRGFLGLDSRYRIKEYDLDGRLIAGDEGLPLGYVKPYETGGEAVKIAAYRHMLIGERLGKNRVYAVDNPGSAYTVGHGRLFVTAISDVVGGGKVDWGYYDDRFVRLNLEECGSDTPHAMWYEPESKYFTITAELCEYDGTRVSIISDYGWIHAVCDKGMFYYAAGEEQWFLGFDMNFPARRRWFDIEDYLRGKAATVASALGFGRDEERLIDTWTDQRDRELAIELAENCGLQSYNPPLVPPSSERSISMLEARFPVLRRMFGMGEVLIGKCSGPDDEGYATFRAEPGLILPVVDVYDEVSFTNESEEEVYWGYDNRRYIKLDLLPFSIRRSLISAPEKEPYIWDDAISSLFGYSIAVDLYESDGTFVRTLGVSSEITYCEDHILVLGDLGLAFTDYIPDSRGRIKFPAPNPPSNFISVLSSSRL